MKRFAITFLLMMSSVAFAGTDWAEVGNGADVIICSDSRSGRLYDTYETTHRFGFDLQYPSFQLPPRLDNLPGHDSRYVMSAVNIAKDLIQRLQLRDPEMMKSLLQWADSFPQEARFVSGDLLDIPDTGIGVVPAGCSLRQLVIQRTPKLPEDRLYLVAHDYWRFMLLEQQAATVVHEVLYRYALKKNPGLRSSEPVRYFNALILSKKIETMSESEYLEIKKILGF